MTRATLTIDMENPVFKHGFYGTILVLRNDTDCHTIDYENRLKRNLRVRSRYREYSNGLYKLYKY